MRSGIDAKILSLGNFSPIVPVQAKIISVGFILNGFSSSSFCLSESLLDNSSANNFKLLYPSLPVKAFAFLVLTRSALIFF